MSETPTTTPATQTPAEKILNSPTLIMGRTHAGKSSLLVTAAEYVWETYQKVTLWYLSDGGGLPLQVQSLMNLGIIRLWKMRSRSAPGLAHETCEYAAAGYWPAEIDPKTGETAPDVRLVPPMTTAITMYCSKGHVVKVVAMEAQLKQAALCPTCREQVTAANMTTAKVVTPTKGFELVGARFYDGITSMMPWGIDDLTDRNAKQELMGEKSALGGVVHSGTLSLAGSNRAQVGFMQNRAQTLILRSGGVLGMVIPPIWTALVQDGNDESGLMICGPQIIGQARTAEAPQWFGDTIEVTIANNNEGKRFRRMNLKSYIDPQGTRHLCGVRSYPGLLPDVLEDEDTGNPNDASFVNFSMGTFYRLRDQARRKTEELYRAKYTNAPGLPEGTMTVGGPVAATATTAAPVPTPAPAVSRPAPVAAKPRPAAVKTTTAAPAAPAPAAPPAAAPAAPTTPVTADASGRGSSTVTPTAAAGGAVPAPMGSAPRPPVPRPPAPPAPRPAVAAPTTAAPVSAPPALAPSPAATGPVASPPAPKPPARGPSAPPPGRRPVPAPTPVARPAAPPTAQPS